LQYLPGALSVSLACLKIHLQLFFYGYEYCFGNILLFRNLIYYSPAMDNLFEPTTADVVISRLEKIQLTTQPRWGKMNAAQMMAHCQATFEVFFGEKRLKRGLPAILFGKMAKKKLFINKPWPKNLPTAREFKIADQRDMLQEKAKLVSLIKRFSTEGYMITETIHPFFGKMSSQEWAMFAYKHLDHHLTQFGA
jgi:hypothetical protein